MSKRSFISVWVAYFSLLACAASWAEDGSVNFHGEIVPSSCDINGGDNHAINVDLGPVLTSQFGTVGKHSNPVPFTINLQKCPSVYRYARITFDGQSDTNNPHLLQVEGGAEGIAIRIDNDQGTEIPLHTLSQAYTINQQTHAVDIHLKASYESTSAQVTPGQANATSQFTIEYQ